MKGETKLSCHDVAVGTTAATSKYGHVVLAALLVVATFLVYAPALDGELLLDDDVHITRSELRSRAGLVRIWADIGATQQYYPVLHTAFWLEHRAWGDATIGYHVLNVLLHAATALIVVGVMAELGLRGGWLAGFLFALHPIAVESVAWIAEQKNTLSAALGLAAIYVHLRFDRERAPRHFAWAFALFVFALLTKTATAMLAPALVAVLAWRRGRLEWKRDLLPVVPWFVAAAAMGAITLHVERRLITAIDADVSMTLLERVVVACRVLWFYVGKILWPTALSFFYARWTPVLPPAGVAAAVAAAIMVTAALVTFARRIPGIATAAAVFVVLLSPVLGFVDVQWFVFSFVADHFAYLGCLAVIVPCSAGLMRWPAAAMTLCMLLIGALGVQARCHARTFHDNVAVYANAVARTPRSAVAHNHLGVALSKIPGRLDEAIVAYENALRINPRAAEVRENLGQALLEIPGRTSAAIAQLEAALELKPSLTRTRRLLAGAYFDQAKQAVNASREQAIADYQRALQLDPQFVEAYFNLGNLLLRDPARRAESIACYEAALRLKPDFAEAHTNLGIALAASPGQLPEAKAHFEAALRANPDFTPARNNLRQVERRLAETPTEVR